MRTDDQNHFGGFRLMVMLADIQSHPNEAGQLGFCWATDVPQLKQIN